MQSQGVFYGVGLGPGAPGLITVAAQEVLSQADCVIHPASSPTGNSFSREILQSLNIPVAKMEAISLCMGKDRTQPLAAYRKASDRIAGKVRKGQSVAFITEGDPFFYSTFIYLYEAMKSHHSDIPIKIISGISSVFHAAGKAGLPVARQDERVAILPSLSGEEDLHAMYENFHTLFLLKLSRSYSIAFKYLERRGLLDQAVYLEKLGTPEERVERDIRKVNPKKVPYFAMLMIRKGSPPYPPRTAGRETV